ncbi:hypothetical protein HK100_001395 [Physocladia obscura]|uniref:YTH domain-containing protein n=1 Tax=Physocladia obscura TaxID=109957 RepID=A0AAD5XJQ1_9FUNG|nr:hypothetical protein HK100_001395 [Physocladia obscura]
MLSGSISRGAREMEMDKDKAGGSNYADGGDSDTDQILSLLPRLLVEDAVRMDTKNKSNNNKNNNLKNININNSSITSSGKSTVLHAQALNQPALASPSLVLPLGFTARDSTSQLSSFHSRTSTFPPPNLHNQKHYQQLQSLLNNSYQQSVQSPHSSVKLSYAALSCPAEPECAPSHNGILDFFGDPLAASSSSLLSSADTQWNVGSRSHHGDAGSYSRINEANFQRTRLNTTDTIHLNVRPPYSTQNISGDANPPIFAPTEERLRRSSAATLNSGHFLDSASYYDEYREDSQRHLSRRPSFGAASSSASSSSATIASSYTHLERAQQHSFEWFEQQDEHNFMSRHHDQQKIQLQHQQKQQQHLSSSNQLEYGQYLNQQLQQQAQLEDMSMPIRPQKNGNEDDLSSFLIEENFYHSVPESNNSGGSRRVETIENMLYHEQYQEQQQHRSLLEPQKYHQNYPQQTIASQYPTKISGTLFTPQLYYPPPTPLPLALTFPTAAPPPRSRAVSLMIAPSFSSDFSNQMNQNRQYQQYHPQNREQSQQQQRQQQQQRYRSVSLQIDSIPINALTAGTSETTHNNKLLMNSMKMAEARFFPTPNNIDCDQQQLLQQRNYKNSSTGRENFQIKQQNQKQRLLPQPLPQSQQQNFFDGKLQDSLAGGTATELRANAQEYLPAGQQMQQLKQQQQQQQQQKLQFQFQQQQLPQQKQEKQQQLKNQQQTDIEQIPAIVESSTTRAEVQQMISERNLNPHYNFFNPKSTNSRFFVIKSFREDHVFKSMKHNVWSSTEIGNKRLHQAYQSTHPSITTTTMTSAGSSTVVTTHAEPPPRHRLPATSQQQQQQQQNSDGHVYLFFSVNGSGHFCGVAEMTSAVDWTSSKNSNNSKNAVFTKDGKWDGMFRVQWLYVKDIPNQNLRHLKVFTNEGKAVTNSRDTQEVGSDLGWEIVKIFAEFELRTCILDDWNWYESRDAVEAEQAAAVAGEGGQNSTDK